MPDLNLMPAATVRHPRGAVKVNGTLIAGWTSWSVDNNVFRAADTFTAEFATTDLPAGFGPDWFASQTNIIVEIFANTDPIDPTRYVPSVTDRLIYGQSDDMTFDPVQGTIELTGRDLTAKLIDTKTSENHQNATASQVATLLAEREGLKPIVTATTTTIGKFYEIDHTDINAQQSEWDLLVRLADFENFDVFVIGDELHFQPKPQDGSDRYAIVLTPSTSALAYSSATTIALHFSRSLTIAKGVIVEVRSWNAKQKKAFTSSFPKSVKGAKPGMASSNTLAYHFHVPGLTQDQATDRAKKLYEQIVQHMVKLEADLPGDALLDCTKSIMVRGTGTAFDQVYYPDSVKRSMSISEGYRMSVTAKNISQDVEAAAA